MKYLLVKGGPSGFGDRLESLIMYVNFALKKNLQIYVDWVDPIWSHNGETFYTYFDLVNIPKLKSIDDIPEDATVYPPVWKGKLKLPLSADMSPEADVGSLVDQDFDGDVIVCSSNGFRHFYRDVSFFGNVFRVIDNRILSKIKERQRTYDLKNKVGIHLRGTDRATRTDKTRQMSFLGLTLITHGLMNGTNFIAVSDDKEYVDFWKKRYPNFPILTEIGALGGREGVHNKSKESINVSKDLLNVDLITDFFTLASCSKLFSTSKDSRFAKEATRLRPHVAKILGK